MIKKAVLPLLAAPFLMVFSHFSYAGVTYYIDRDKTFPSPAAACLSSEYRDDMTFTSVGYNSRYGIFCRGQVHLSNGTSTTSVLRTVSYHSCVDGSPNCNSDEYYNSQIESNPSMLPKKTDEECKSENSGNFTSSASVANYLTSGGTVKTAGGACSISSAGGVAVCVGSDSNVSCSVNIEATSTGEYGEYVDGEYIESLGDGGTFSVVDFNTPDYLEPLPGGCSDPSSCVTIGDTSYLVDWDASPDYFSYVDANGNTHSKSSRGGGSGSNNEGDTPTDPTDPDNDSGGGESGGDSGGGSTVPDFEFDESGIIEAIRSSGQSNQNAIDALSNDVTSAINGQTNDLKNATEEQTNTLTDALERQSDAISDGLDDLGDTITTGIDDAVGKQTEEVSGFFEGLGKSLTGALGLAACYPNDGPTEDGHSAATDDKGLLGCIQQIGRGMVTNLVNRLTKTDDMPGDSETAGMVDGQGVADGVMESLEQGADQQDSAIYDEFEGIFEGGGIIDGALSPLRDFVTSFLPSLPSGGCTPLTFGAGERSFTIDCEGFNLLKAALSWLLFFFTAYQLISIPMDARKSQ